MNIFKVLASGKKPMFEEQMSAMLAWLLHPQMEHGLGHEFLSRFIGSVSENSDKCKELKGIADGLCNRLRGDAVSDFGMELEETVHAVIDGRSHTAAVDMVITIDNWIIGIENKIDPQSASDTEQLNKEYAGLREKYNDKNICLIFLVPTDYEELPTKVLNMINAFKQDGILRIMTWQNNNREHPSVISLLEKILRDESDGIIEPISDYTRHTLKALIMFIRGNFSGYDRELRKRQSGNYPYVPANEIIRKTSGVVGTMSGLRGFIRKTSNELKNGAYQYSDADNPHNTNWVSLHDFKQVYEWKVNNNSPDIKWDKIYLGADILFEIVSACPSQSLYVGIQGGLDALVGMKPEEIKGKEWQLVTSDTPPSTNWISGDSFMQIYNWKINNIPPDIKWDRMPLGTDILYDIVSACPSQPLCIGLQGGPSALEGMVPEIIKDKKWQLLTSDTLPGGNWMNGKEYLRILDAKGGRSIWS